MKRNFKYIIVRKFLSGFTLIELLVVISIIALLVSILMPALGRARDQARNVICLVNTRQQGLGMKLYSADHSDKYPFASAPGWFPFGGMMNWTGTFSYVPGEFEPVNQMALFVGNYITQPDVFYCPAARVGNFGYINREDHWDYAAENYSAPEHFGYRCYATSVGYTTWAGYGYDTSGQFCPEQLWPDIEQRERYQRRATKNIFSRGDTVVLSDIILEKIGPDAPTWNNHSRNGEPIGGNIHFNDGSAIWLDFSETECMLEIQTRQFNFRF